MREIKFRGKNANGTWIYGNLVYMHGLGNTWTAGIQMLSGEGYRPSGSVSVNPETIGQYTGLKDKNGVEIYEGDITSWGYVVSYVDGSKGEDLGMNIGFYTQRDDFESWAQMAAGDVYEVICNIYEKPKLLEDKGNDN